MARLYEWRNHSWKIKKKSIIPYLHLYLHKYISAMIYKKKECSHDILGWELSLWREQHGVGWHQGSESLLERKNPLGRALLGISWKWGKAIQGAYCLWPMQPQGLLSQGEEENLRGAVRADVHMRAPEYLLDLGAGPRLQVQAQRWGWFCLEQNPQQAPRGFSVVSWAPGTLLQNASCQAEDTGVSSAFWGGLGTCLGGSVFRKLEVFTGFGDNLFSSRAGTKTLTTNVLLSWAGPLSPPEHWGFCYVEKEAGPDEWMGHFCGIMLGSCANPCDIFAQERLKFPSCLWDEPLISLQRQVWDPDWNQVWWIKQGWYVSSWKVSGCYLMASWFKTLSWSLLWQW